MTGYVYAILAQNGWVPTVHPSGLPERIARMAQMYRAGARLQDIGDEFGISRERARQLLRKHGVETNEGGVALDHAKARAAKAKRKSKRHGCTLIQWREAHAAGATRAYQYKRQNAINVGGEWNLSLWDFWCIWRDSGKWQEMGRSKYVLTRIDRSKPWQADNVKVVLMADLNSEIHRNRPRRARKTEAAE
jgi:hypothetical protein